MTAPGLLVVDKDGGMTSHDVVARVRRLAGTRKVGHAGTLDPMATGVLVLGVNRATRLLGHLLLADKSYDATIRLGTTTTTDDAEGEVVSTRPVEGVTEAMVRTALEAFVGDIEQVPSSVSAIKVGGRRAYDLVRAGEEVRLEPRRVHIAAIDVTAVERASGGLEARVSVRCSSGTYIRALARDLGEALGVGGHLTALRRTTLGPFGLEEARTLADLEEGEELALVTMERVARRCFVTLDLDEQQAAAVRVGRSLDLDLGAPGPVAVFGPEGDFLALYADRDGAARAVAVFV